MKNRLEKPVLDGETLDEKAASFGAVFGREKYADKLFRIEIEIKRMVVEKAIDEVIKLDGLKGPLKKRVFRGNAAKCKIWPFFLG